MQTALTLTSMLMATASASPMVAASSTATPTMGQPLVLQDAPLFAGTVIDEILRSATSRDATPFYWVNGNKCANFKLNSGDIPYVKKNCAFTKKAPAQARATRWPMDPGGVPPSEFSRVILAPFRQ